MTTQPPLCSNVVLRFVLAAMFVLDAYVAESAGVYISYIHA